MAPVPTYDKIAFEMYEAAARTAAPRTYLGMSQIGNPCERALWYQFRGYNPKPQDGRMIMLFRFGDRVEDEIIYWLMQAGYRVEGQQDAFQDFNGMFRGHCDGIIHDVTRHPHILECKSANSKRFKAFKDNGVRSVSETYYAQAQCYMEYAGLERALFIIQCKDNSEIYTERLYHSKDDAKAYREKAFRIISANELPPKIFAETSFECRWCDYSGHCWNPTETPVTRQVCGTCRNVYMDGDIPWCKSHNCRLHQWGLKCDLWTQQ
jgi:hypothetical protein